MRPIKNSNPSVLKFKPFYLLLMLCLNTWLGDALAQGIINRSPAVAGAYYPGSADSLRTKLAELFATVTTERQKDAVAVIAPHAGYRHSGDINAFSIHQLDPDRDYERIFIVGVSHTSAYSGVSIYNVGHYQTPLGTVTVDLELANELINKYSAFNFHPDAHLLEHSIEVQLPMLQYHMKKDFKIVPLLIGSDTPIQTINEISRILRPYFNEKNFFIISTDLSHYPTYEDALVADKKMTDAICTNSVLNVIDAFRQNVRDSIPKLTTSACAIKAVFAFMNITEQFQDLKFTLLAAKNSGDVPVIGFKGSVVGYASIVIAGDLPEPEGPGLILEKNDKVFLLKLARKSLETYYEKGIKLELSDVGISEKLKTNAGVFVTLNKERKLRGCIGNFMATEPLYQSIPEIAISSAISDTRFEQVKVEELTDLDIEISVLTPLKKIENINEIKLGRHGIYITDGNVSGTFLPQVARETGWSLEEFLGHCSQDKAGLGWDGWKTADVYIYEAIVFSEHEYMK